jgi:UDP-N-acetylglucosamine acyltransferase
LAVIQALHQFCQIGSYAMMGGASLVLKDIPAFVMVSGNPAQAAGMNFEGMRRRGWSSETITLLKRAYKIVYRQGLTLRCGGCSTRARDSAYLS